MSFDRLCDIHFDHLYYNDEKSNRLGLKLVPSIESEELIRKRHITIRNNGKLFSLYGDIYEESGDGGVELVCEFKLSFAVVVDDVYFTNASDIPNLTAETVHADGFTLRQGNGRGVYYLHNNRTELVAGKAYLSAAPVISPEDMVPLRGARFVKNRLAGLSGITVNSANKYSEADRLDSIFTYEGVTNPAQPSEIKRSLYVDLGRFSNGLYTFAYRYNPGDGVIDETASFYLDDRFTSIRPFAVIDLFFYSDISENYRLLNKDLHVSIGARKSTWRYNVISKYNSYENKTIVSTPAGIFPATGTKKTLKNGESATVFESISELETKQIIENTYELNGKHVETLGIAISVADGDDDENEGEEETSDAASATVGLIRKLPTPKAENLVLEMVTVGDEEEAKFFSELFVYI